MRIDTKAKIDTKPKQTRQTTLYFFFFKRKHFELILFKFEIDDEPSQNNSPTV